jgi:hypothetical protein
MAATPKKVRKQIKDSEITMKKSTIFPKEKMHKIAKDTAKSMKKNYHMTKKAK